MTLPSVPLGAAEFPLVLLRRMADFQPKLVEDARQSLGFDLTQMRAVNAQWQRMLHNRHTRGPVGALRAVLGRPAATVERKLGDFACEALQWELAVWPGLRFEALLGPGGMLLAEQLVRAPGVPRPGLRALGDLRPWSCVIGDVAASFGPLRHLEGSAPTRDLALAEVDDGTGRKVTVATEFVYGLLQDARRYERARPGPTQPG